MGEKSVRVLLRAQCLELLKDGKLVARYPVSTSKYGAGEVEGSEQTPRGRHEVAQKVGAGKAKGAVFLGREATGEICNPELVEREPGRDWILSRILWLRGLEEGRNLGGSVDTERRHIYLHGTPDEDLIGQPASHGCIRMRNDHVIELFDLIDSGTPIEIIE